MAKGFRPPDQKGSPLLLEPTGKPLPGGLIVVPTFVLLGVHTFPAQVINLSNEDVWLGSGTRLGLLTQVEEVQSNDTCEVQFQRILADTEEVRINKRAEGAPNAQSILNQLNVGRNPEQRKQLASLLTKYSFMFAAGDENLGYSDRVQHEIHLTDDAPVVQPYRQIPPTQYGDVR